MFTITIQKPTGEEATAELIRVAEFYKANKIFETPPATAVASKRRRTEAPEPTPAPTPEPTPEPTPAPAAVAPAPNPAPVQAPVAALKPEELRVKIRGVLTPHMRSQDKAGAARALVKKYADSITACPEDKLQELLAEAEAL